MIHDWRTTIDLADAADWITFAAYLMAAASAFLASLQARKRTEARAAIFWVATSALLVFFAVNEILDLQTLLTIVGREHAKAYGWYAERRLVQFSFFVALTFAAIFSGIVALRLARRSHIAVRLALGGMALIAFFILVRALSINHVDQILAIGPRLLQLGSAQELVGIVTVAGSAWLYLVKDSSQR